VNDQQTYSASLILHPESGKTMRKLLRGASSVRGVQEFRTDLLFAICYLLFAKRCPFDALNACLHRACRDAQGRPFDAL